MKLFNPPNHDRFSKSKIVISGIFCTLTLLMSGAEALLAQQNVPPPGQNGGNPAPTRVMTSSGAFVRTVVTVKQKFYIKATATVGSRANGDTVPPPPSSVSLGGHWATVAEAQAAFKAIYEIGAMYIIGGVSVDIGSDEVTSGPSTTYKEESERSAPKSQKQITTDAGSKWGFVEWIGEPPPKCEIAGLSASNSPVSGNVTTISETVNYSWTSNWKEIKL